MRWSLDIELELEIERRRISADHGITRRHVS